MPRNPAFAAPEFPLPTVATRLRDLADTVEACGLPAPKVDLNWHQCDDDTIRAIVAAFPAAKWHAAQVAGNEWVTATLDRVDLTAFAVALKPTDTTPRLAALLADANPEQVSS